MRISGRILLVLLFTFAIGIAFAYLSYVTYNMDLVLVSITFFIITLGLIIAELQTSSD